MHFFKKRSPTRSDHRDRFDWKVSYDLYCGPTYLSTSQVTTVIWCYRLCSNMFCFVTNIHSAYLLTYLVNDGPFNAHFPRNRYLLYCLFICLLCLLVLCLRLFLYACLFLSRYVSVCLPFTLSLFQCFLFYVCLSLSLWLFYSLSACLSQTLSHSSCLFLCVCLLLSQGVSVRPPVFLYHSFRLPLLRVFLSLCVFINLSVSVCIALYGFLFNVAWWR